MVITDFQMPAMDGAELVLALRAKMPDLPSIVMTGYPQMRSRIEALPAEYVAKPFGLLELLRAIANAVAGAQ
jgi:CheY-like chemotaxis protein